MDKQYSYINIFLRSLLFSIISIITIILYSFIVTLSLVLPLRFRYMLIRPYLRFSIKLLEHLCLIKYEISGLENIAKVKNGIVLCKHQSTWETFMLPLLFHDPAIIAKKQLLFLPFFGWGLAASDPIAINRSKKSTAMEQIITKGKKCLEAGRWIIIFPEGTRIPYGKIGTYRLGGTRLSVATNYPIIPVAHNAGLFWPRRKFLKIPGTIYMVIGPPIYPEGHTPESLLEVTKNWIENTVKEIDQRTSSHFC